MGRSSGERSAREQVRRGVMRIAEPRQVTSASEWGRVQGSELVAMGYVDMWRLGSRGILDEADSGLNVVACGSGGVIAATA